MPDLNAVQPGPPNSGPEPPGLQAAVGQYFGRQQPAAPNAYELLGTDAACLKLLTDTRKMCDSGREAFEWGWWRSLLYFLGRHWIYWNPSSRTWNDKRLAKWIPKPVTNKIRETYDSIYAVLSDISLSTKARPVGTIPRNVLTAEVVDQIGPLLHIEHGMDTQMGFGDFWAILLGNAYGNVFWDKDNTTHASQIPLWACLACAATGMPPDAIVQAGQKCPNCGSRSLTRAKRPDGSPLTKTVNPGCGQTRIYSPLELLLPLYAQSWEAVDRLISAMWLPRHEVEELCADSPDVLRKIQWTTSPQQRSLQLYRSLAMQSDLPMSPAIWNSSSTMNEIEGATIQYLWLKAGRTYDRGVYLTFIGEGDSAQVLRQASPEGGTEPVIPQQKQNGAALWPWVHYPYKRVAGRLFAQSAVDNLLQKNDQVNQIDSMTQLVANRMGNPIWLEPKGAEVERFTGEPGLIVRYQTVGPHNAKPERIAGENPPQSFFALRQQFLQDIEDLSGTYDVVKGSKPSGVEAFSALQLLVERSQSRFTPVFKARGEFYRQWMEIAVELERKHGPTERVKNTLGPNNTWTQKVFQNSELQGEITIVVEDGSNTPKTALGRRAAIEHSNQLGLLSPQQNPDQMYALMQELGTTSLVPTLDADVKSALQEQQAFEDWFSAGAQGPPPLVRMPWHADPVHFNENRKWMNSDAIREILGKAASMPAPLMKPMPGQPAPGGQPGQPGPPQPGAPGAPQPTAPPPADPNAPPPQGPGTTPAPMQPQNLAAFIVMTLAQHLAEHQMAMMAQMQMEQQAAGPQPGGSGGDGGGVGAGRAAGDSNRNSKPQPSRQPAA